MGASCLSTNTLIELYSFSYQLVMNDRITLNWNAELPQNLLKNMIRQK